MNVIFTLLLMNSKTLQCAMLLVNVYGVFFLLFVIDILTFSHRQRKLQHLILNWQLLFLNYSSILLWIRLMM